MARGREGCPQCRGVGYVMTGNGSRVPCPECSKHRSLEATRGITEGGTPLAEVLGFEGTRDELNLYKKDFDFTTIFPPSERGLIENLREYEQKCEEVYFTVRNAGSGSHLDRSYCIFLGVKGNVPELAYSLLIAAYQAGTTVCPVVTPHLIQKANSMVVDDANFTLRDAIYKSDFSVVMLPEGSFKNEILSVKGYLQNRAVKQKPTVVVTTTTMAACSTFLDSGKRYDMATPVVPMYKRSEGGDSVEGVYTAGDSRYLDNITGVTNSQGGASDFSSGVSRGVQRGKGKQKVDVNNFTSRW